MFVDVKWYDSVDNKDLGDTRTINLDNVIEIRQIFHPFTYYSLVNQYYSIDISEETYEKIEKFLIENKLLIKLDGVDKK